MPINKPTLPTSPLCVAAFNHLGYQSSMSSPPHRCWFLGPAGEYKVIFCQVNIFCFYSFKEKKMRPIFLKSWHFYLPPSSLCSAKLLSCLVSVYLLVCRSRQGCLSSFVCVFLCFCASLNSEELQSGTSSPCLSMHFSHLLTHGE